MIRTTYVYIVKTKEGLSILKPFSFVHVADLHLGYAQYNLDVRREDFEAAFREVVDKTIELGPDFIIIAGDIFQHACPSNFNIFVFHMVMEESFPMKYCTVHALGDD